MWSVGESTAKGLRNTALDVWHKRRLILHSCEFTIFSKKIINMVCLLYILFYYSSKTGCLVLSAHFIVCMLGHNQFHNINKPQHYWNFQLNMKYFLCLLSHFWCLLFSLNAWLYYYMHREFFIYVKNFKSLSFSSTTFNQTYCSFLPDMCYSFVTPYGNPLTAGTAHLYKMR